MSRLNREFQSVLIPPIFETTCQYVTLHDGTVIYEHHGLNAQPLGPIPAGYTLWISQKDLNQDLSKHCSGTVRQIYQGWKIVRRVTVGTTAIVRGTYIYY